MESLLQMCETAESAEETSWMKSMIFRRMSFRIFRRAAAFSSSEPAYFSFDFG